MEELAALQSNRLEAAIGKCRHYLLGQEDEAANFAARVMYDPATPDDIQRTAKLWNARIACNRGEHSTVLEDLATLSPLVAVRAQAQYLLAEHDHNAGAFDAARKTV